MNPETQSTRAKITQTSVNGLAQVIVDSSRGSQDRSNSGDVGLHKSAWNTAAGSSAADVADLRPIPRGAVRSG